MADSSLTSRAITAAACSSLKLTSSSTGLLSLPQLIAIESELCTTLNIIRSQIRAELSDDSRVIIDLTHCESSSEDGDEDDGEHADTANADGSSPSKTNPVPGPYPTSPPKMDKLPDHWYVVDRGSEVGLFANVNAEFAIAGVAGGHYVKTNSWYDAAILYNELYHRGEVIRVVN